MTRESNIRELITLFNSKTGKRFKYSAEVNQKAGSDVLDACKDNMIVAKKFFRENSNNFETFVDACEEFVSTCEYEEQNKVQDTVQNTGSVDQSINFLGAVVTELLAKTKLEEIKAEVGSSLREDVQKFIQETYGPINRKVTFELPERKFEPKEIVHEKFETILKFVQMNEPVYLAGPAGSGKNVICKQVAEALGLNFYFSNAVTQEYKLTGFTDANGTFHESQFYKAFKNGGVFMLDEMDASIPEVLIILNAAIANRYFDFPAPIGYVEANENFRVIAAGNTFGQGADSNYVGRSQLDAASLDRFALVRVDYDSRIEDTCANGDQDLVRFCRKFRNATAEAGIQVVVSYRAIGRLAKLSQCMEADELLDTCLIKSLDIDDLNAIASKLTGCGRYTDGFNKVIESRKVA